MPLFNRTRKARDVSNVSSTFPSPVAQDEPQFAAPPKRQSQPPQYEDPWARKEVAPDEVEELLHICTEEMKSRALDMPFLLLPFRPYFSDPIAARAFIRKCFAASSSANHRFHGQGLYHELKLIEPMALCSILKWCWSRLKGGVVTWNTYKLFRAGEQKSNMAKNAFPTFIPLSVDSAARKNIVFDFFDLLAAIAANSKTNGLGGRQLSRLAGWWAFDQTENGKAFDEGYKSWARAADATSHMFFAYLRSLAPESKATSGMSRLPRSVQALVAETEYPPETPMPLQGLTSKVVMLVDAASPSPVALLRRAKHLEYGFSGFDDPIKALTAECRRVLTCISSPNQPVLNNAEPAIGSATDNSWLRFEDIGFSSVFGGNNIGGNDVETSLPKSTPSDRVQASTTRAVNPPSNPSWADFLVSGFADDAPLPDPASLSLPPEDILPPLSSSPRNSSNSVITPGSRRESLHPGELASRDQVDFDETFWWVWITSLGGEETPERKAVFGRCACVETEAGRRRWLIIEERFREIVPVEESEPEEEPVVIEKEKKSKFSFGKRARSRQPSGTSKPVDAVLPEPDEEIVVPRRNSPAGPDKAQQAQVQAAAVALVQEKQDKIDAQKLRRRGRSDESAQSRTASVVTVQPMIAKDAGPALQWARKFDKEVIRARYLGDAYAGRGQLQELSPNANSSQTPGFRSFSAPKLGHSDRELPPLPLQSNPNLAGDFMSSGPPTPVPEATKFTRKEQSAGHTASPFSPLPNRTDAPKSLIPSPLAPRRKPVGSGDYTVRNRSGRHGRSSSRSSTPDPTNPFAPDTPPATRPMEQSDTSPESPTQEPVVMKRSKQGSVRGFRKLFGKRVASEPIEGHAVMAQKFEVNRSVQPPAKSDRKRSFLRRKPQPQLPSSTQPKRLLMTPTPPMSPNRSPDLSPIKASPVHNHNFASYQNQSIDGGEPGPAMTEDSPEYFKASQANTKSTVPREPGLQNNTFSNFSRGPVSDSYANQPPYDMGTTAHEYESESDSAVSPLPVPRTRRTSSMSQFHTRAAAILYTESHIEQGSNAGHNMSQRSSMEFRGAYPKRVSSQNTTQDAPTENWGGSRWAQIRQHATARRLSEEQSSHEQSLDGRTEGMKMGESSGEESIEARMARIKARVAELTGSSGPPSAQQSSNFGRYQSTVS